MTTKGNIFSAENHLSRSIQDHIKLISLNHQFFISSAQLAFNCICKTIDRGGVIYTFGNRGSACDAAHLTSELVGRYRKDRQSLPSITLNGASAVSTCIGNDYDFSNLFSRQLQALARPADLLVAFSTSGQSPNIVNALRLSYDSNFHSLAFLGSPGGQSVSLAENKIIVPSSCTARVQEAHSLIIHLVCEMLDINY